MISTGTVEGMSNRLKVITRGAYGFRTYRAIEVALYDALGKLSDLQGLFAHRGAAMAAPNKPINRGATPGR